MNDYGSDIPLHWWDSTLSTVLSFGPLTTRISCWNTFKEDKHKYITLKRYVKFGHHTNSNIKALKG